MKRRPDHLPNVPPVDLRSTVELKHELAKQLSNIGETMKRRSDLIVKTRDGQQLELENEWGGGQDLVIDADDLCPEGIFRTPEDQLRLPGFARFNP
jgi:hypothetical protein